jgi:hypothetical protein
MKRSILFWCFAATAALANPALGDAGARPKAISGQVAAAELELHGLEVGSDGSVTGTVLNNSGVAIRDVGLLVSHAWSWSDERRPGEDNPGRASHVRVAGEIPAQSSISFSYAPDPPLMQRPDGTFRTTATVQSFTKLGD